MKTPILVLTDFCPAGQQALHYAVLLAQQLHLELIVLHTFKIPANSNPEIWAKMRRLREENAQLEFRKIKHKYEAYSYRHSEKPLRIRTEASQSSVGESICRAAKKYCPLMLVTGSDNEQQLSSLLSGKKTRRLIESTQLPLLIVPLDAAPAVPRTIVYATDLKKTDAPFVRRTLLDWTDTFSAEMDTVHITTDTNTVNADPFLRMEGERKQEAEGERVHVTDEIALSFIEGLDDYLAVHPADMLVLVTRKYPVWKQCMCYGGKRTRYRSIPLLTLGKGSISLSSKSEAS